MRAGGCALQQALTAEAAGLIKQAVVLAKRRGHAQVTPLHVANTMLAASNGLLRLACLESHSHPLQCKALELCFNVALNRLPASSSSNSLVGSPHHHSHQQYPSISNALVAAFKRAQAHHRRGSIENHPSQSQQQQQQSILAVKIELEQLIISILDDPSVSRVMREAGFSSTQVKTNVEKAVISSSPPPPPLKSKENKSFLTLNPTPDHQPVIRNEDVNIVIETLLKRTISRKSLVVVGESISTLESTVKGVMDTVDKGGVPDSLREVKFITIPPLYSFCNLRREEVDQKIGELTCLVDSLVGKGVILNLGDLKWISDYRVSLEQERNSYYCSVEHMIMELGRLVWRGMNNGENEKFWLMGIATFQTYMKCRSGYNSLETVWGLHPVTIPANTLGFSLASESDEQSEDGNRRMENRSSSSQLHLTNGDVKLVLSCCADCSAKLEAEVRNLDTGVCRINANRTLSSLPYWLKDESTRLGNNDQNYDDSVREIHKKWNKFCSSSHKKTIPSEGTLITSSSDQDNPYSTRPTWTSSNGFGSNPSSSTPNSASSSDVMDMEYTQRFKEFNAENLNIICNALEKKVPCQREIIPEIAGTILQSRSGMLRRRKDHNADVCNKEETWLFFLGGGAGGARDKEKISRELARIVFGSYSSFVSIGLISSFVSSENCRTKRGRDEQSCMSYMDRFARAVAENPHRVFLVEDLEQVDYCSKMGIKRAIERGRLAGESGEEVDFCDAIIILSCDSFGSRSRRNGVAGAGEEETTANRRVSLDLNLSLDDGDSSVEDHESVDDVGILEYVDRRVVFKIQDL